MQEWLNVALEWIDNPIIQVAALSFFAALLVAKLLSSMWLSGLAIIAAFCATVYMIADFDFDSLTITKKIIVAGLVASLVAPLFDLLSSHNRLARYLIAIACVGAVVWVFWPVLERKDLADLALYGSGLVVFIACLSVLLDRIAPISIRASTAAMGLGASIGVSALLSASALLGQFGFAIAMAGIAYLLLQFISNRLLPCGRTFTIPLTVLCGLIAPAAMILAKLPWYCLPLFLLIPLAAQTPLSGNLSIRLQTLILSVVTIIFSALPVLVILYESGDLPYL
ncbi:MAG: hypothetical protein OEX82_02560 [Nitrosomonas sp.]|nr:hypothetical protein [Nitrosomonas sp.]